MAEVNSGTTCTLRTNKKKKKTDKKLFADQSSKSEKNINLSFIM